MQLQAGANFAGYAIERCLGTGGMGSVYLARHPRLERLVALKLLTDSFTTDQKARAAFDREVTLTARLDHPNIVAVYDRSGPDDPALWLTMRYVAGGDAGALLEASPRGLPPELAVRLIRDAAEALDFAHDHGVVHRDVKPANLLIERLPKGGFRALLGDFGIARTLDDTVTLTSISASFAYAAPERFTNTADHRADIYSLGCTLYHLLTGRYPFPRDDQAAVIAAHLTEAPPSPRALRPELPAAFDTVIATALAKKPVSRYPTCVALAEAAEQALTAVSGSAPAVSVPDPEPQSRRPRTTKPITADQDPADPVPKFGSSSAAVTTHLEEPPAVPDRDEEAARPEADPEVVAAGGADPGRSSVEGESDTSDIDVEQADSATPSRPEEAVAKANSVSSADADSVSDEVESVDSSGGESAESTPDLSVPVRSDGDPAVSTPSELSGSEQVRERGLTGPVEGEATEVDRAEPASPDEPSSASAHDSESRPDISAGEPDSSDARGREAALTEREPADADPQPNPFSVEEVRPKPEAVGADERATEPAGDRARESDSGGDRAHEPEPAGDSAREPDSGGVESEAGGAAESGEVGERGEDLVADDRRVDEPAGDRRGDPGAIEPEKPVGSERVRKPVENDPRASHSADIDGPDPESDRVERPGPTVPPRSDNVGASNRPAPSYPVSSRASTPGGRRLLVGAAAVLAVLAAFTAARAMLGESPTDGSSTPTTVPVVVSTPPPTRGTPVPAPVVVPGPPTGAATTQEPAPVAPEAPRAPVEVMPPAAGWVPPPAASPVPVPTQPAHVPRTEVVGSPDPRPTVTVAPETSTGTPQVTTTTATTTVTVEPTPTTTTTTVTTTTATTTASSTPTTTASSTPAQR